MAKVTMLTFVTTIPLTTDSYMQAILRKCFFAAQQQYNALLGEDLQRPRLMKADNRYEQACQIYKKKGKKGS